MQLLDRESRTRDTTSGKKNTTGENIAGIVVIVAPILAYWAFFTDSPNGKSVMLTLLSIVVVLVTLGSFAV